MKQFIRSFLRTLGGATSGRRVLLAAQGRVTVLNLPLSVHESAAASEINLRVRVREKRAERGARAA
jgi:hypothetical protein